MLHISIFFVCILKFRNNFSDNIFNKYIMDDKYMSIGISENKKSKQEQGKYVVYLGQSPNPWYKNVEKKHENLKNIHHHLKKKNIKKKTIISNRMNENILLFIIFFIIFLIFSVRMNIMTN